MMTKPSLDELLKKVDSPYTLVILSARRARQLNEGRPALIESPNEAEKPVSRALEEIAADQIQYRKPEKYRMK